MVDEKIAFDLVEDTLLGKLFRDGPYGSGASSSIGSVYRMGLLKVKEGKNEWEVYNLTENHFQSLALSELHNLKLVSKDHLTEEEAENLEKLLKQP